MSKDSDHVCFPALGRYGRLGNQLFQLVATVAHAHSVGLKPRFPPLDPSTPLRQLFDLPAEWFTLDVDAQSYTCDSSEFYEAPWNYEPIPEAARVLHGYFQSPRWWPDLEYARKLLRPAPVSRIQGLQVVHVRRGDYAELESHHPLPPADYYRAELERRSSIFVSDDPVWCVKHLKGPGRMVSLGSVAEDFLLMGTAERLVMSNSTLAWWAAYLFSVPEVVYPKAWFGPALAEHDVSQLFPASFGWVAK